MEKILCENGRCKYFLEGFIIIDYWTIYVGLIFILKQLQASIFLQHFYLHNSFKASETLIFVDIFFFLVLSILYALFLTKSLTPRLLVLY